MEQNKGARKKYIRWVRNERIKTVRKVGKNNNEKSIRDGIVKYSEVKKKKC